MKARVFVIRGQGGWLTSAGMDQLCLKLDAIPGVFAAIYNWSQDRYILSAIDATPPSVKVMMIGYSLGAHTCTRIPNYRPIRLFELIVGIDPSRLAYLQPVGKNVKQAICFYNPGAWLFGGAKYQNVGKNNNVDVYPISDMHLLADWDGFVWRTVLNAVSKTLPA